MLSPDRIAKLNAMSAEDMAAEVAKGRFSRFNEESRQYMNGRLAQLGQRQFADAMASEVGSQANADRVSAETLRWTKIGVIVAVIGIGIGVTVVRYT